MELFVTQIPSSAQKQLTTSPSTLWNVGCHPSSNAPCEALIAYPAGKELSIGAFYTTSEL